MKWLSKLNPFRSKSDTPMDSRALLEMISAGGLAVSGVQINTDTAIRYAAFFTCL